MKIKALSHISTEMVKSALRYDPQTGIFYWREFRGGRAAAGAVAGAIHRTRGYVTIRLMGEMIKAHRLAWLYVHGVWPPDEIDHINGVPTDNRIANLRQATRHQNMANAKMRKTCRSGLKGVHQFGKYWQARIAKKSLGFFKTKEEAAGAYRAAATEKYGEFARFA